MDISIYKQKDSPRLTEVVRARELFGTGRVGTVEGSFQGMGLDVSLQMLQPLKSLRTSNLGASMMLSRTTMLASTATTAAAGVGTATCAVGAACSAAGTAATGALDAGVAAIAVDDVWRGRGYNGTSEEKLD